MIRCAIALLALDLCAALVLPSSTSVRGAILAVAMIACALVVIAPEPATRSRPAPRSRRRTSGGAREVGAAYAQVPTQRDCEPRIEVDQSGARLVGFSESPYDSDDPRVQVADDARLGFEVATRRPADVVGRRRAHRA